MGGVFVTTGTTCEAPLEEQQQLIFKGQAEMGTFTSINHNRALFKLQSIKGRIN